MQWENGAQNAQVIGTISDARESLVALLKKIGKFWVFNFAITQLQMVFKSLANGKMVLQMPM